MSSIERRLRKLERNSPERLRKWHRIIVDANETESEVIQREFGGEGVPEGTDLILRTIVEPKSRDTGGSLE